MYISLHGLLDLIDHLGQGTVEIGSTASEIDFSLSYLIGKFVALLEKLDEARLQRTGSLVQINPSQAILHKAQNLEKDLFPTLRVNSLQFVEHPGRWQ